MSFLIGPEHPDYLELFYGAFGAGQSYPARLVTRPDPESAEQEQDPEHPSDEHQRDIQPDKSSELIDNNLPNGSGQSK